MPQPAVLLLSDMAGFLRLNAGSVCEPEPDATLIISVFLLRVKKLKTAEP
jgi:hypothetical protein